MNANAATMTAKADEEYNATPDAPPWIAGGMAGVILVVLPYDPPGAGGLPVDVPRH
jgi:hypothetical protein